MCEYVYVCMYVCGNILEKWRDPLLMVLLSLLLMLVLLSNLCVWEFAYIGDY